MNPKKKQQIEQVEKSFKNGNISSRTAKQQLDNIGINRITADRFVKFWTSQSPGNNPTE